MHQRLLVTAAETGSIPKEPPLASNGPSEQGTGVVTRKARREELIFFAIVANHVMLNACFMTAGQNTRRSACPMGGVDVECKKGSCGPRGATMVKVDVKQ